MSIISIHGRDPGAFARSVLHYLLQHGDIAGRDAAGRTLLQLAVDDWLLDELCAFDAAAEDLEDNDAEPEPEDIDGAPIVLEVVRSRRVAAAARCLKTLVVVLMLVSVPYIRAEAQQPQGLPVLSLPISTVETTPQMLPDLHQRQAVRGWLHQRRPTVQAGLGLCLQRLKRLVSPRDYLSM
jgi:hypothetical protein